MSERSDPWAFENLGPAIRLPDGRVMGGEGFVGHDEIRDRLQGHERRLADLQEADVPPLAERRLEASDFVKVPWRGGEAERANSTCSK